MMLEPSKVCHPANNAWGGRPCEHWPIKGDTWWFRYRQGYSCQMSLRALTTMNFCPDFYLRTELLEGDPQINVVYVWYWPEGKKEYSNIYAKHRAAIRNALQSNSCPNEAILNTGLPGIKYFFPAGSGDPLLCRDTP